MANNTLQTVTKQFSLTWDGLVRPSPKIIDTENRQHARLLSGMLLVMPLTLVLITIVIGLLNGPDLLNFATIAGYFIVCLCIGLYFFNRAGHFYWVRRIFIGIISIIMIITPYIPDSATGVLPFAIIPVLLVGIYYSGKWIYLSVGIVLIATFLLNQSMYGTEDYWRMQVDWYFLLFGSGLSVIFIRHKRTLEQLHIQKLERANQQLRESERLLEQRVEERTAELREAYEELEALNTIKDEFVANVSHELRTPISSIKLQKYLLQQTSTPQQEKYLEVLDRETDRLEESIESLLRLSRLDQKRQKLELRKLDLNLLVRQYVADRELLAGEKQLTLQEFITCEDGVWVMGDSSLLGQVLSILLTNALNYTSEGGKISVSTAILHEKETPKWAQLSVQDTGIGIAPEEQDLLFSRFYRGTAAVERKITGTGLGLSIAKAIVDNHKGYISVESSGIPGDGTTFHVKLPLAKG